VGSDLITECRSSVINYLNVLFIVTFEFVFKNKSLIQLYLCNLLQTTLPNILVNFGR